jgi:hypothetical protein
MELTCQGCQRRLRVPDTDSGKKARCPSCGTVMDIPAVPEGAALQELPGLTSLTYPSVNQPATASVPGTTPGPSSPATHQTADDRWTMIGPDGTTYGPVTRSELELWVREGRVDPRAMLKKAGDDFVRRAVDLFPQLANAVPLNPYSDLAGPNPDHAGNPFGTYLPSHRAGLIMGLGIAALCCSLLQCACIPSFPVVIGISIAALVMGSRDLKRMNGGSIDPSGRSQTIVGIWLAAISIALTVLQAIVFFVMLLAAD